MQGVHVDTEWSEGVVNYYGNTREVKGMEGRKKWLFSLGNIVPTRNFFVVNIIELWSNYCLIQKFCYLIHYFRRYGHFRFDIKIFCALCIIILCEN